MVAVEEVCFCCASADPGMIIPEKMMAAIITQGNGLRNWAELGMDVFAMILTMPQKRAANKAVIRAMNTCKFMIAKGLKL